MSKFHVNPETGRANICRATKKGCPLGVGVEHFDTKTDANEYIEQEAKKASYSFSTVSKKNEDDLEELVNLPQRGYGYHVDYYLDEVLPPYFKRVGESIEGPDYVNASVVASGKDHYVVRTMAMITEAEAFDVYRVVPEKTTQVRANAEKVSSTSNSMEVNSLLLETKQRMSNLKDNHLFIQNNVVSAYSTEKVTFTREDESKIYCYPIYPPGDRSFHDFPDPVATDVEFTENGQKQNSRTMDRGYVIFDSRSNKGVLMKFMSASDGKSESSEYKFDGKMLTPKDDNSRWSIGPGHLYLLSGKGETQEATYYKKA